MNTKLHDLIANVVNDTTRYSGNSRDHTVRRSFQTIPFLIESAPVRLVCPRGDSSEEMAKRSLPQIYSSNKIKTKSLFELELVPHLEVSPLNRHSQNPPSPLDSMQNAKMDDLWSQASGSQLLEVLPMLLVKLLPPKKLNLLLILPLLSLTQSGTLTPLQLILNLPSAIN